MAESALGATPALSDVKIKQIKDGQVREYFAHKVVLGIRSRYFSNMFTGAFKESTADVIELHDDDPDTFKVLLQHIYMGSSPAATGPRLDNAAIQERVALCVQVYAMADKYEVPSLMQDMIKGIRILSNRVKYQPFATFKVVVDTYYNWNDRPNTDVGLIIAEDALNVKEMKSEPNLFKVLMLAHPIFAADIAFVSLNNGMLSLYENYCACAEVAYYTKDRNGSGSYNLIHDCEED